MKKTASIAALAFVILACAVISYRNIAPGGDDGYIPPRERAMIKRFDKNGDGALDASEKRAADAAEKENAEHRKVFIQKFDKDGDGQLNKEERAAAGKDARAQMIKRFDTNGDGKLSPEEGEAARNAFPR